MKPKRKTKPKLGRPSKFKEAVQLKIIRLAEAGATEPEISEKTGIPVRTIQFWKSRYSTFLPALKGAKEVPDQLVEISLFQRAIGYSHPEVKVFCNDGEIVTHEVERFYPPDPTSMIYWLKNRQRAKWRDQPKDEEKPAELDPRSVPTPSKILASATHLAFAELERLREKATRQGLTPEDHRSLATLTKAMIDMTEKNDASPEAEDVRNLPNDELLKQAEEAVKGLRVISGGKGAG